jgi:tetratricopeptide (TPR) repeat protein
MRKLCGVLLLVGVSAFAQAQGGAHQSNLEQGKGGDRPWARGVPEAEQKRALDLFKEGNQALKEPNFQRAAQKYREALEHWDHPAIHYNLALALLNLVQPLETHEEFVASLKYGKEPLDADKFEQANRYKAQLEQQLAGVDIRCNMEGAQVKLDGKTLYTAPGRYTGLILPGPHSIVATKPGYITNELSLPLPAGQTKVFELNLLSDDDLTEYKRLWPQYVPYVVLAAGVAIAAVGLGLHMGSNGLYKSYDTAVSDCALSTMFHGGCATNPNIDSARIKADVVQGAGFAAYAVGGVLTATGAILIFANRLQPYRISVGVTNGARSLTFLPFFGPSGGGAALTGTF